MLMIEMEMVWYYLSLPSFGFKSDRDTLRHIISISLVPITPYYQKHK